MHLDMDAFFASVEQVDNPELRGKPVIIGRSMRGVVSAASYEARKFGVRSAMPVAEARRRCPHGVFVSGSKGRYGEVSGAIMEILHDYSPAVQQVSVDEAYLDATGLERLFGSPIEMARHMKQSIFKRTGLTSSVGIAPNKFLAKICSDINKPDGIYFLLLEDVPRFLTELEVGKVGGIGRRMVQALADLNVRTMGDVASYPLDFWVDRFGDKGGRFLYTRSQGVDPRPVRTSCEPKSSGAENTFSHDTQDRNELEKWLWVQAERVGRDLRKNGYFGRTVTLKLKFCDFKSITRSNTLEEPVNSTQAIFDAAAELLKKQQLSSPVRLIGVSVSQFSKGQRQLGLLGEDRKIEESRLDQTIDSIRERFGRDLLERGRVMGFRKKTKE
jgi:DNA polymerase-4